METPDAMSHLKDQLQTTLQYAHNLVHTVFESIKRVFTWTADYFTDKLSYCPVVEQATPLDAISKNEAPWANEAAQYQTKKPDDRIAF